MSPLSLFLLFAKLGCFCFGGGYVLIPLIISELIEKRHLMQLEDFGNLLSIAQVTPGPVGMNTATYVGYIHGGVAGSLSASVGLIMPSLILGTAAVYTISRWKDSIWVQGLLRGIRPVSMALLFYAVFLFMGMSVFTAPIPFQYLLDMLKGIPSALPPDFRISWTSLIVCIISVILMKRTKISTTTLIIGSAALGTLICR